MPLPNEVAKESVNLANQTAPLIRIQDQVLKISLTWRVLLLISVLEKV